jgi:hypothetical protein
VVVIYKPTGIIISLVLVHTRNGIRSTNCMFQTESHDRVDTFQPKAHSRDSDRSGYNDNGSSHCQYQTTSVKAGMMHTSLPSVSLKPSSELVTRADATKSDLPTVSVKPSSLKIGMMNTDSPSVSLKKPNNIVSVKSTAQ